MKEFTKLQRINLHYYSLIKLGVDLYSMYGCPANFFKKYDDASMETLKQINEVDAQKLAQYGLTLRHIANIYAL